MFRYIDRPIYCERDWYDEALSLISKKLIHQEGVKAVYRFGNITIPGISDLDILVVFEKSAKSLLNGFEPIEEKHKKLFTHGIMAIREDHFHKNMYYTIWSEPVLLEGTPEREIRQRSPDEDVVIKKQTGLEFLLAHYIDMAVQLRYRIFKLRALLQHTKGLIMDLEFLGIRDSPIHPLCRELREKTITWFEKDNPDKFLDQWIIQFTKLYFSLCEEIFNSNDLYFPGGTEFDIAKNIKLIKGKKLGYTQRGIVVPDIGLIAEKKHFKLLNKLNRFYFNVPITDRAEHPMLKDRFLFLKEMKTHNRQHFPNFMTITTSVTSKVI